jgi:2-phosphoglycerate kinase
MKQDTPRLDGAASEPLAPWYDPWRDLPDNLVKAILDYRSRSPDLQNAFVVFIGGGAATGKSTLAMDIARLFGIKNVLSTDALRQAVRIMHPSDAIIQAETWEVRNHLETKKSNVTIYDGLLEQVERLEPFMMPMSRYFLSKGMTSIIEGIHVLPSTTLQKLADSPRNVVFFVDSTDDRIHYNYRLRRRTTHLRAEQNEFQRVDDRIALHREIIQQTMNAGMPIIEANDWRELLCQATKIILNRIT